MKIQTDPKFVLRTLANINNVDDLLSILVIKAKEYEDGFKEDINNKELDEKILKKHPVFNPEDILWLKCRYLTTALDLYSTAFRIAYKIRPGEAEVYLKEAERLTEEINKYFE